MSHDRTASDRESEESEPVLTLFTAGLFSKWGFGDGDMPADFIDWCEARGVDYEAEIRLWSWHQTLIGLVRDKLLPALDVQVETVEIGTNHNPIRASKVNGEDVEDRWYAEWSDYGVKPESVSVPYPEVLTYARATVQS